MLTAKYKEIQFSDADVVNPDEFIPASEYNPHKVHPILIHAHGFPIAIVFAEHLQDALDIAVDAGKLDAFKITEEDYEDYDVHGDSPTCAFLGNASEPFDIETLGAIDLPNPPFSFVALFKAAMGKQAE